MKGFPRLQEEDFYFFAEIKRYGQKTIKSGCGW